MLLYFCSNRLCLGVIQRSEQNAWHALLYLATHSGLLQQVLLDLGSLDGSSLVEVDVDVFPEAAGVVVTDGFSVPEGCWVKSSNRLNVIQRRVSELDSLTF